ncbi:MAG: Sec-independent protein translocase protein TatB [Pelagimonas sp.]|jgi:sec-independent protein translocase protein TatB|nr:Sec-independent protein translocase protein TatB [Pelagimonas sp.]
MTGLSWSELLVVGVVALIVVGPKDLPVMFRRAGQFFGKARGMAREFSRAMNDAADSSGVNDMAKTFKAATNPVGSAMDGVKDAVSGLGDIDPNSETGKLSKERQEAKDKIHAAAARSAAERKAREAEEALKRADELEANMAANAEASKLAEQAGAEAAKKEGDA